MYVSELGKLFRMSILENLYQGLLLHICRAGQINHHCMKSVQIQSFFCFVFSYVRTEYREIRTRKNSVFRQFSSSNLDQKNTRRKSWKNTFITYAYIFTANVPILKLLLFFPGLTRCKSDANNIYSQRCPSTYQRFFLFGLLSFMCALSINDCCFTHPDHSCNVPGSTLRENRKFPSYNSSMFTSFRSDRSSRKHTSIITGMEISETAHVNYHAPTINYLG